MKEFSQNSGIRLPWFLKHLKDNRITARNCRRDSKTMRTVCNITARHWFKLVTSSTLLFCQSQRTVR